ncbi:MAG: DUF92 domain-containing protein [Gemmatimonadota bacterium]
MAAFVPVTVGAVVAAGFAGAAWRAGSLSRSGAAAAALLGTLAAAAGPAWAAVLIAYFVSSSALSRLGAARKASRTAGTVAKGGARDAAQVLANGAAFGVAAGAWLLTRDAVWAAVGAGALAASAADTWATEVGTWVGGTPRHVLTWRPLDAGMSGGVTVAGSLAMIAGAVVIGACAEGLGLPARVEPVAAGGLAGALADSVLGATLQERRRCEACGALTEQVRHACGGDTRAVGGAGGVGNDVVNALATAVGAVTAGWVAARAG